MARLCTAGLLLPALAAVAAVPAAAPPGQLSNSSSGGGGCAAAATCAECVSSSQCGWCGRCTVGDPFGPYADCSGPYSFGTPSACGGGSTAWLAADVSASVVGAFAALVACFAGYRFMVGVVSISSAALVALAVYSLLVKAILLDVLPQAAVSNRTVWGVTLGCAVLSGVLPYLSWRGAAHVAFFRAGLFSVGALSGALLGVVLLSFRISGAGLLTLAFAAGHAGGVVVQWGLTAALGCGFGMLCVRRGGRRTFVCSIACSGAYTFTLLCDKLIALFSAPAALGLADGAVRALTRHTAEAAYGGTRWGAGAYLLLALAAALAAAGSAAQLLATARGQRHLTAAESRDLRGHDDALGGEFLPMMTLDPATGEYVRAHAGAGDGGELGSDSSCDSQLVQRARSHLAARRAAPQAVQALEHIGLAITPVPPAQRRRRPQRRDEGSDRQSSSSKRRGKHSRGRSRTNSRLQQQQGGHRGSTPSPPAEQPSPPPEPAGPHEAPAEGAAPTFAPGVRVQVWYPAPDGGDSWFGAAVYSQQQDGTYTVCYDTGEVSEGVAVESMHLECPPSPLQSLQKANAAASPAPVAQSPACAHPRARPWSPSSSSAGS
eukprot:TRINITY_DN23591_c0_g2_i1.p1 TRINITY_DN23591_c0_g2~~TRINITY_DN23591_c0_g2_i1.p1  ORF type:complete len:629 (+),score=174.45 TRINITY_DN23591_c0_g2_i1:78-1889(+)